MHYVTYIINKVTLLVLISIFYFKLQIHVQIQVTTTCTTTCTNTCTRKVNCTIEVSFAVTLTAGPYVMV
jgi:hypothetical protein